MTFWLMQRPTEAENPPTNDPYVSCVQLQAGWVQAQPAFWPRRPTSGRMQAATLNILVNVKGIKDKQDACPT
ncbi:MAG: hypothetical protein JEZ07_10455 [Phycisphaerae bacterium]|nr:hypothetical protein [Phycisphaerae bacterium]